MYQDRTDIVTIIFHVVVALGSMTLAIGDFPFMTCGLRLLAVWIGVISGTAAVIDIIERRR